jgi:hypothetical protein
MKFLNELIKALEQHKPYNYSDDNTTVKVTPNSVYISYNNYKPVDKRQEFLDFCDGLDDELFTSVCDSFAPGELKELQHQLDTDNYQNTIDVFADRVKTIAAKIKQEKLAPLYKELEYHQDGLIKTQEMIDSLKATIKSTIKKYSI